MFRASWADRRSELVPITLPSGSEDSVSPEYFFDMTTASRGSSRLKYSLIEKYFLRYITVIRKREGERGVVPGG